MRKSIYFKNFLATAVLVFMCFLVIGTAFFFIGRNYLIRTTEESLSESVSEVTRTAAALSWRENLSSFNLRMNISSIAGGSGKHIFVCDTSGKVVSCSDMTLYCQHLGMQLDDSVIDTLSEKGSLEEESTLMDFYEEKRIVEAEPIVVGEQVIGYAFASAEKLSAMGNWSEFTGVVVAVCIAVIALAMIMSLLFSKKLAEPLDEMARASRKFAHGDFSVRVNSPKNRDDEIGTLLDSFNSMADSLEKSESQRREFIANVSHELRTPMTTIAGFADGIVDGTIPRELEDRYLRKIADETRRLSRLVRNMLDLSQAESKARDINSRTKFDISELVLKTLLSFESRATEKNLDVDPQLPEDPISVVANMDSITQVIYNLMDNAVKFAEVGSTLSLRVYQHTGKAYVSVKNTGEGIPPEDLPYIFDRFHKSDRSRSLDKDGVGLGLYLVKTILNSHDEDIVATSRNGVTEFVFTLPLA